MYSLNVLILFKKLSCLVNFVTNLSLLVASEEYLTETFVNFI